MNLWLAIQAFFKTFKDPQGAQQFVEGVPPKQASAPTEAQDPSHLRLLTLLQDSSRFVDFFKEDIQSYSDTQIGAAVRKIHADCSKCLEEYVTIRPLRDEEEGARISIPKEYDASQIKLVGQVKGEPPYVGTLVHKGWKAHKRSLPKKTGQLGSEIICPAEIEIKS